MKTDLSLAAPYAPAAIEALAAQFGSPLFVIDCEQLRQQYRALAAALPGVDLHYALKPLPDRTVVQVLAREGSWFDLATNGEVDLVRDAGIPPSRCVHTHPIKRGSDIRHALDCGVSTFVVDNAEELEQALAGLLGDGGRRATQGAAGRAVLDANRGALDRLLTLVDPLLE